MPKGSKRRIRMNRAVGLWNKMDEFEAAPEQYRSLVGAGYADRVSEPDDVVEAHGTVTAPGEDGGDDPVRGEPDNDEDRAA